MKDKHTKDNTSNDAKENIDTNEPTIDVSNEYVKDQVEKFMGEPIEVPIKNDSANEPTPPATPEPPKEEPKIDLEAEKAKWRAEYENEQKSKDVTDKEKAKDLAAQIQADATQPFLITPPWDKEKRVPKDLTEVVSWIREENIAYTKAELKRERESEELQKKEAEEQATKEYAETENKWNIYWDTQLDELASKGKIPPISESIKAKLAKGETLSAQDAKDPGVVARADIFNLAQKNQNLNLKEVYYEYYVEFSKNKNKQPAGANAPISAGRATKSDAENEEFTYDEIHGAKSLRDLLR